MTDEMPSTDDDAAGREDQSGMKLPDPMTDETRRKVDAIGEQLEKAGRYRFPTDIAESLQRLSQISLPLAKVQIDPLITQRPITHFGPRPEVTLLQQVHKELEGMAALQQQSGTQANAMLEVTKANLNAIGTVVEELQRTRASADQSSRAITSLTRALLIVTVVAAAATIVAAIAVGPDAYQKFIDFLNWIHSNI